jgi:hypothetical protein
LHWRAGDREHRDADCFRSSRLALFALLIIVCEVVVRRLGIWVLRQGGCELQNWIGRTGKRRSSISCGFSIAHGL